MKEEEYNPEETVFTAYHSDIQKTGQKQCEKHSWRKLSDTEIACTRCFTAHIVNNADEYL